MHKRYIDMLICPSCHNELIWNIEDEDEDRIINGNAVCPSCKSVYEIRNEIAVFLTNDLSRNDLWKHGESELERYLGENPGIYDKLMNTPEGEMNGADYWFKASYFESKNDFKTSSGMFKNAYKKIYTQDYIDGWKSQIDFIVNNIKSDRPIIDIASGKGYLVEKLLKERKNYVVATDFSPTVLERNKEYYKYKGLYDKLSLIAFDARRTPFKDSSIEILTSNMGLQNIECPGEVTKEMNRITKDTFMSVMFFIDKEDKIHMDLFNKYGNAAYVTRSNAIDTFKKAGWNVNIANSFLANIMPTPEDKILKGASIDGFPIADTKIEFCVIQATK